SIPQIMGEVLKDRSFFAKSGGGLTLSGGEPLAQIVLAEELIRAALAAGVDVAIETCLAVSWKDIERVADLKLRWLADLKHVDPAAYRRATGGDARLALGNLRRLADRGADLSIRVPLVPGFNDDEASMREILEFAAALPPAGQSTFGRRRVDLLPYHDLAAGKYAALGRKYNYPPGARVDGERMNRYAELGLSLGLDISLGG
ncbi:MAG: radical SAM protein, partial [Spirochaetaceae bacterium]|nr:radical SAM protein [Spirochaetaceae bacterium]